MKIEKKQLLFLSSITFCASIFWYLVRQWIYGPVLFADYSRWFFPTFMLIVVLTLIALYFLLTEKYLNILFMVLLVIMPFIIIFGVDLYYFGAFILLAASSLYGWRSMRENILNRITINIWDAIRHSLWTITLPIMIIISFAYYNTPVVQQSAQSGKLPKNIESLLMYVVSQDTFTRVLTVSGIQKPVDQTSLVQQTWDFINFQIRPLARFIPPALAFGLFIILQAVSVAFTFAATLLASLLFDLLIKLRFILIEKRSVKAETITF